MTSHRRPRLPPTASEPSVSLVLPDRREGVSINVIIPKKLHRQCAITCTVRGQTIKDGFIEAVRDFVAKHAAHVRRTIVGDEEGP